MLIVYPNGKSVKSSNLQRISQNFLKYLIQNYTQIWTKIDVNNKLIPEKLEELLDGRKEIININCSDHCLKIERITTTESEEFILTVYMRFDSVHKKIPILQEKIELNISK